MFVLLVCQLQDSLEFAFADAETFWAEVNAIIQDQSLCMVWRSWALFWYLYT